MSQMLTLEVTENGQTVFTAETEGPIEMGRQRSGEPEPYQLLTTAAGQARLLVARQREGNISRQHVVIDAVPGGLRVHNLSPASLEFESGPPLASNTVAEYPPPIALRIAGRSIRVEHGAAMDSYGLRSLDGATIGPGSFQGRAPSMFPAFIGKAPDALVGYLQTTLGVLQSTLGAVHFLEQALEAMVHILGLSSGRAILWDGNVWKVLASAPAGLADWEPSRRVLDRLRQAKCTVWQEPSTAAVSESESLAFLQTVVAAPLLNAEGRIVGALYGERRMQDGHLPRPIGKLEALLIDVLACGVATGLARQEHERAAVAAQVRFEQFFTPELARHLAREPTLLDGRDAEVTLLFCDIRGFSRISGRLGPAGTVEWVGAVMDELSGHVLDEGGVLVDYIGDELLAMWGAPQAQPDHVQRAVRAALRINASLPALNARWQQMLGEPIDLGIGLNTGVARVGNTGSRYKFKYGPLGHTVNLASRVQGVTKYLKCRLLVTAETRSRLGPDFIARRVCRTRVVNIAEPVDLFVVAPAGDPAEEAFFRQSEAALALLENRDFAGAAGGAGALLQQHPGDGPLRLTLARAAAMLVNEEAPFDPVWAPPGK
jgi:adenylate cyclase